VSTPPSVSLEELAGDPDRTAALPPEVAVLLLARVAGLQAVLLARCLSVSLATTPLPDDEPLLTVPDVARRLGFAESYVYELVRVGRLPAVRTGKYVRIRRSTLREWMVACESVDTVEGARYGPAHERISDRRLGPSGRADHVDGPARRPRVRGSRRKGASRTAGAAESGHTDSRG
jgi:excisionase family DNA binding protein